MNRSVELRNKMKKLKLNENTKVNLTKDKLNDKNKIPKKKRLIKKMNLIMKFVKLFLIKKILIFYQMIN